MSWLKRRGGALVIMGASAVGGAAYRHFQAAESTRASLNPYTFTPYTLVEKKAVSRTSAIFTLRNGDGGPDGMGDVWKRSVWSVEIKQPQLQIARAYTPLPPGPGQDAPGTAQPADIRLLIRQEQGGEVSTYLHRLPATSTIELRGPNTEYELPADVNQVIFLAGGTGIAPAMQIAHALATRPGTKMHILWANRRREECRGGVSDDGPSGLVNNGQPKGAVVQELDALKERANAATRGMRVQYYVDEEKTFLQQAHVEKTMATTLADKGSRLILVSGPSGFVQHWAGAKVWVGGTETQGPLGGVLGKMKLKDWKVVKL
ncbi:mitochondrial Homoaconitase [Pleosporales sp. CAS-2024a]